MRFEMPALPEHETAALRVERDRALCVFLHKRLAEVAAHGCGAEIKALAGIEDALAEFETRHAPLRDPSGYFGGQMDALGWVLRCVAFSTFSRHPEFQDGFRPDATVTPPIDVKAHR